MMYTRFVRIVRGRVQPFSSSYCTKIDASKLVIEKTKHPKKPSPVETLMFGHEFTDHMLEVDWNEKSGWGTPHISEYKNLSLSPASTGLHYGIQCFEGMKAYKDSKGKVRLFRPDMNMKRMNNSMTRLAMPELDQEGFLECMRQLIKMDASWVPDKDGYSLYIRPTAIGTSAILGVHASADVKLFTILSPVGPYYKSGIVPVRLLADSVNVRAWPGGVGHVKVGGNYAPTIDVSRRAAEQGYQQVLWLYGSDHQITEVGAMNMFFLIRKENSDAVELITPPLTRGDILPGVTRDSILALARSWPEYEVSERFITMKDILQASKEGRLIEAFGAGTAVIVAPVCAISYMEQEIKIPTGDQPGPLATRLRKTLLDIQYGRVEHPWSVEL